MKTISQARELRKALDAERRTGRSVGLVPTMGYFHEGHLSLIREARRCNDVVVVSVFVNPTQFGPEEDYMHYPRDVSRDTKLAEEAGTDYLFVPSVEEVYDKDFCTWVKVDDLTEGLCGISRPGHFQGVTTTVTKLFNIILPDQAYFGQKDWQQLTVIKKMVKDLDMRVEIVGLPIIREEDGLAMSSRNVYLSSEERKAALVLVKSLSIGKKLYQNGERETAIIKEAVQKSLDTEPLVKTEYLAIVDTETLKGLKEIKGTALIALAAKVGRTRLIDNTVLGLKGET